MYLQIKSPNGQVLDLVPVDLELRPQDGCYGLIEVVGDEAGGELFIQLTKKLRCGGDQNQTVHANAMVGKVCEHDGFRAEIIA